MIKLLFNTLSILKKKHGKALEMIKAAINHVLDDVCTQTGCIKCANVCTKKCNLFETFSCFVFDFLLNLQPKKDTNWRTMAKFNITKPNIKVKI